MAVGTSSKVVQVTNIAPQATKDQMQTLFGYLGKIEDIRLYPTIRDVAVPVQSRICYIKFHESSTVAVAQHMTNTVFIDRALIVIPYQYDIPDEQKALELTKNGTVVPGKCCIKKGGKSLFMTIPTNQFQLRNDFFQNSYHFWNSNSFSFGKFDVCIVRICPFFEILFYCNYIKESTMS